MNNDYPIYAVPEAGAVVIRKSKGKDEVLVVHRVKQKDISLPKGHVEQGESLAETVLRELKEETGYDIEVDRYIDSFEYEFIENEAKKIHWIKVYWFLARPATKASSIINPLEIKKTEWVELSQALMILSYENDKSIIRKAISLLEQP